MTEIYILSGMEGGGEREGKQSLQYECNNCYMTYTAWLYVLQSYSGRQYSEVWWNGAKMSRAFEKLIWEWKILILPKWGNNRFLFLLNKSFGSPDGFITIFIIFAKTEIPLSWTVLSFLSFFSFIETLSIKSRSWTTLQSTTTQRSPWTTTFGENLDQI